VMAQQADRGSERIRVPHAGNLGAAAGAR
jgi:hypothetical protein